MKTTIPIFSNQEKEILEKYRDNQENANLKIRFIALLMLDHLRDIVLVADLVGVSFKTIGNWLDQYLTKGVGSLNSYNYKPKKSYLNFYQINQVVIYITFQNPENTKEIREYIKEKFGVDYCIEAVRQLLKKRGLKYFYQKTMPGNPPTVEVQEQFVENYEQLKATKGPSDVILFGDAMHLHHQNIPCRCWGDPDFRPIIQTNTGRRRINILGAYNPETYSISHLIGEENCDADRVVEFFEKIVEDNYKSRKIHLILDNAKYFYANKAAKWLEKQDKLEIIFLPPYAPNLNLIERFWKFAKKELVKNMYYKKYKQFRASVFKFFNNLGIHAGELSTLMVEKFEIIMHDLCQSCEA